MTEDQELQYLARKPHGTYERWLTCDCKVCVVAFKRREQLRKERSPESRNKHKAEGRSPDGYRTHTEAQRRANVRRSAEYRAKRRAQNGGDSTVVGTQTNGGDAA